MTSTLFVEEIKGRTTGTNANKVIVPSGQSLTVGGAFTSPGIDDNADTITITLDANEDITASNGMYVSGDLTSLTVDKGGIDRSGNTTRIISGRSGGNYADMSINIAGVGGVNRQVYIDYQGNTTLDNGNLVIGTSGKGISFAATAAGSGANQSELLDDYEEGTWTPTLPRGGTVSVSATYYVKIGAMVYAGAYISISGQANEGNLFRIGGLPYAVKTGSHYHSAGGITYSGGTNLNHFYPPTPYSGGGSELYFHRNDGSATAIAGSQAQSIGAFIFALVYITDS
tara:strand:+ start:1510 stop:2364 length:855 start_codon:yes stop_codon:yes gene_type:complete